MTSRIQALRKARGWSQETLASEAGVTQSAVSKLERGARGGDEETLARIARALGVDPSEIAPTEERTKSAPHDSDVRPTMAQVPGWSEVIEEAKTLQPKLRPDTWATLEASPSLFASDVPLTPAFVAELAVIVQKHTPVRKK